MGGMVAVLDMQGAGCPSCAYAIERLGAKTAGVRGVYVDIARHRVTIRFDGNPAVVEHIQALIANFGHAAVVKSVAPDTGEAGAA